jgi:hypothetical protein
MVTIQDLGSIGELVAALATVATLLYLAMQIRQNSLLIRSSTYQAGNQWNLAAMSTAAQSPQAAKVLMQGLADPRQLNDEERTQFTVIMHLLFTGFGQHYVNYRSGAILDEQWRYVERIIRWYLGLAGTRVWLLGARDLMFPEFLAYLDDALKSEAEPAAQHAVEPDVE